jgi:hypothetical protein
MAASSPPTAPPGRPPDQASARSPSRTSPACITPFTAAPAADTITAKGRTLTNGDKFRLSNSGGQLPAGLATLTDYFVINTNGATAQLSATAGGSAINFIDAGTGSNFLGELPDRARSGIQVIAGSRYRYREVEQPGNYTQMPLALQTIIWGLKNGQLH